MKKISFILIWAASISAVATPVGITDGNALYEICTDNSSRTFCTAFIKGVLEGYPQGYVQGSIEVTWQVKNDGIIKKSQYKNIDIAAQKTIDYVSGYCVTSGITLPQIKDIVVKYLNENPELRTQAASDLIIRSMQSAFPFRGCDVK